MNHKPFVLSLLALFTALLLAACGGAAIAETAMSAATATVASGSTVAPLPPTTTPSPTIAPTEIAPPPAEEPAAVSSATPESHLLTIPVVNCCRGRALEPGTYAAPSWLGIPLAFEVGEGWRVLNEERARLFLLGRGENAQGNPSQLIVFIDATSPTAPPESIIAAARGIPQLIPLGEPVSVAVAGFPGRQLDTVARPNPDEKGDPSADIPPGIQYLPFFQKYFAPGFLWTTSSPEARVRTVALAVGDQTLVLYMEAPATEFDPFVLDADTILRTLRPGE